MFSGDHTSNVVSTTIAHGGDTAAIMTLIGVMLGYLPILTTMLAVTWYIFQIMQWVLGQSRRDLAERLLLAQVELAEKELHEHNEGKVNG